MSWPVLAAGPDDDLVASRACPMSARWDEADWLMATRYSWVGSCYRSGWLYANEGPNLTKDSTLDFEPTLKGER